MTVLDIRNVKRSRLPYQCDGCTRHFPAGSSYQRQRNIGGDGPFVIKWCPTCLCLAKELMLSDLDYCDEGVTSDDLHSAMENHGSWEAADAYVKSKNPTKIGGGERC